MEQVLKINSDSKSSSPQPGDSPQDYEKIINKLEDWVKKGQNTEEKSTRQRIVENYKRRLASVNKTEIVYLENDLLTQVDYDILKTEEEHARVIEQINFLQDRVEVLIKQFLNQVDYKLQTCKYSKIRTEFKEVIPFGIFDSKKIREKLFLEEIPSLLEEENDLLQSKLQNTNWIDKHNIGRLIATLNISKNFVLDLIEIRLRSDKNKFIEFIRSVLENQDFAIELSFDSKIDKGIKLYAENVVELQQLIS